MDFNKFLDDQMDRHFRGVFSPKFKVDHTEAETPVGTGYYAKRKHKTKGKFNWKLVVADRSPRIDLKGQGIPLVGPQTERRRKLLLKRREAAVQAAKVA